MVNADILLQLALPMAHARHMAEQFKTWEAEVIAVELVQFIIQIIGITLKEKFM